MVTVVSQAVKIPIMMMIRPQARSFQASRGDLQAAAKDIQDSPRKWYPQLHGWIPD